MLLRAGAVEAERARGLFAIERQRGAGQRARAERAAAQPGAEIAEARAVAPEHLDEGEPVVGEPHRLRALQMCVARQHRVEVLARARREHPAQLEQAALRGGAGVAQVEREIRRDLIVAAAPGVQAAGRGPDLLAQPRLDVHVDVFEGGVDRKAPRPRARARSPRAPAAIAWSSSALSSPAWCSMRAWASDSRMS